MLGLLGFALSVWIYGVPRFQDLRPLAGEVARSEIVHPNRGSDFGLVTLTSGEVLHVPRVRAMKGVVDGLRTLRGVSR